tara:strand:+ start:548 stop:1966 length:1419 start_codon:yes stop_codon:yes gene_type:complete
VIKEFYKRRGDRFGSASGLAALWADTTTADALLASGVEYGGITVEELAAVLRQRGLWDGWERLVTADGTFPTGLLAHVQRALTIRAGVPRAIVSDERGRVPRGTPQPLPTLFDYQRHAVDAWLHAGRGVIALPPRAGKTRIAVAAVASLGLPTLYVVPGVGLAKQTVAVFRNHGLTAAQATGGRQSAKRQREIARAQVWVATPQTAVKLPGIGGRQVLVLDEFHHAAAQTWQAVSQAASGAHWRLGLTGTHYRADGRDLAMTGVLARAVYERTVADMVGLGRLVPARIAMLRITGRVSGKGHETYAAGIVDHEARNAALTMAANTLTRRGRRVLVLTKHVRHAEALAARISGSRQVDGRDNAAVDTALADLAARRCMAVVGTSVIGEGRDVPACDALVYAAGGKSRVKVKQDYFRALTASAGKKEAIIVDAADCQHDTLTHQSARRLRLYRSEGVFTVDVMDPQSFNAWLGG